MEWQDIETAPRDGRRWQVSSTGRVMVDGKELRQHLSKGYAKISMGGKSVAVHRLVALAFSPNPLGLTEVNHLDGNKANNLAANLAWCTRSENMSHAYASGLHPGVVLRGPESPNWGRHGSRHPQSIAVRAVFPDGSFKDYESQRLAERDGYLSSKISLCITGQNKTHRGAIWQPLPSPPKPSNSQSGS